MTNPSADRPGVSPILTSSRSEEKGFLSSLRCACGKKCGFAIVRHVNLRTGRHYDWVRGACVACGTPREALFDISSWFVPGRSWLGALLRRPARSIETMDYPVMGPPEDDAAIARAMASWGIPLDFGQTDFASALAGGAAKAGLWNGYKHLEEGRAERAVETFDVVLKGLEGQQDARWKPVRAVALALKGRALRRLGRAEDAARAMKTALAENADCRPAREG